MFVFQQISFQSDGGQFWHKYLVFHEDTDTHSVACITLEKETVTVLKSMAMDLNIYILWGSHDKIKGPIDFGQVFH